MKSAMKCRIEFEEAIYAYLAKQCTEGEQEELLRIARRWERGGMERVLADTNAYERPYVPARRWFRFGSHLAFVEVELSEDLTRIVACRKVRDQPE